MGLKTFFALPMQKRQVEGEKYDDDNGDCHATDTDLEH